MADSQKAPSGAYVWWVVFVLTVTQAMAFVDRQVLALLVEPIRRELHADDTLMGLLYGLSFALFYVIVAIPLAWLADRSNRRNILAASLGIWSLMTALCGLAGSFGQLFAARVGVGAGEAGLSPSAQSILADYFPNHRLATALGVFSMGVSIGGGLALLAGGLILQAAPQIAALLPFGPLSPWRVVMIVVGAPGVILALLFLTVREPPRHFHPPPMAMRDVFAHVGARKPLYLGLIGALAMIVFVAQSSSAWIPAFFERRFGWEGPKIGPLYGPLILICGGSGALAGGLIASALKRRGVARANLKASLGGFLLVTPLAIAFPLMPTPWAALAVIGAMVFCAGLPSGGGYATLQEITPPRMRAQMTALNGLMVNLIGAGLGPLSVGWLTDHTFADPAKINLSIALVALIACPIAICFYLLALSSLADDQGAVASTSAV